jgi:putative FmdB family regulatory protein
MPLYEYQCDACGHRFEVIQKYSDAPIDTCPKCGSAVHKLFSSPAIQFKGSGWYITDYARAGKSDSGAGSGSGSSAKSESNTSDNAQSKSESKSEGKTESKSETKSETKSESKPAASSTTS